MTQQKTIDTLVQDIYSLFDPNVMHEPNEDNLEEFAQNLKQILRVRLASREDVRDPLRFSALGKPDRQLWYMAKGYPSEEMTPKTYMKFLIGDVLESVVLLLAKEAGHSVEREQEEIALDGVLGHIDAVIDGTVVDVKTASPFGFKKFKDGSLISNDPFGYVQQLSGYANVITPGEAAAFLAYDKVSGEICVSTLSTSIIADHPPEKRISHLREVISSDTPPERCYEDVPDGASGNRKLDTGCSYCAYKNSCWPDHRVFLYSTGPKFLSVVKKEPNVPEVPKRM